MTRPPPPPTRRSSQLDDSTPPTDTDGAAAASEGGAPRPALDALRAILDDHLRWLPRWHQAAFFDIDEIDTPDDPNLDQRCKTPLAERAAMADELVNQPAFQKLAETHGELHRLARSMLVVRGLGQAIPSQDYRAFTQRTEAFFNQLRRLERAFAAASSGIDPLTGLRNRNGMLAEIGQENARFQRTGKPYCLAVADLDRFKAINDTHGHEAGDRVLNAIAGVLVHNIRTFDDAYRLGGEEFLIVLKETPLDQAQTVIERVRSAIEREPVALPDGTALPVTVSVGLAEADRAASVSTLMSRADDMLYKVKHEGRNAVATWRAEKSK